MPSLACACIVGFFVFGYGIYLSERIYQPVLFNFPASLYLSVIVIVTGYATDTFSTYNPVSVEGKLICILAVVFGLMIFFWLLSIATENLVPTGPERQAVLFIEEQNLDESLKLEAAILIQRWWRCDMSFYDTREFRKFEHARKKFQLAYRHRKAFAMKYPEVEELRESSEQTKKRRLKKTKISIMEQKIETLDRKLDLILSQMQIQFENDLKEKRKGSDTDNEGEGKNNNNKNNNNNNNNNNAVVPKYSVQSYQDIF